MSRVGVVEEPLVRRSRERELFVSACCSNNVGDRIPPILDRPLGTPAFPPKSPGSHFGVRQIHAA
jgi:hypothetical protein